MDRDFNFTSPEEVEARILRERGDARVAEILSELTDSLVADDGLPGQRGYFKFKPGDGEVIRRKVLDVVQRQWEAHLGFDADTSAHVLIIVRAKPKNNRQ